ncbi:PREDICTED: ragulator complex protein LAMTOR1-like [Priapulus caudatus]|uniref:Ragulator complex protein LAMTOR1 n=1 Tax=Priapulus caudatus TaxID=37621 RepID=A0ABM1E5S1_PRICU|nr:PREDICTED: ragulator complex protein LAMTOR1-like [Priapulus caudatus]
MGCCCSSEDEKLSQDGDPDERTRLILPNPVSNSQVNHSDSYGSVPSSIAQQADEQSALSRILMQTANNVIDVSAIETHMVEQHEYIDRATQYSSRLTSICHSASVLNKLHRPALLVDVPALDRVLSAEPISASDLQFIRNTSDHAAAAMRKVVVTHKEDLVVNFGIP